MKSWDHQIFIKIQPHVLPFLQQKRQCTDDVTAHLHSAGHCYVDKYTTVRNVALLTTTTFHDRKTIF